MLLIQSRIKLIAILSIVIDGNSTDSMISILKSNSDTITRWISEPDSGIYFAMNKGISMSNGDIIGILNSDDILYPSCEFCCFSSQPNGGYTCGPIDLIDRSGGIYGKSTPLSYRRQISRRFLEMPCPHQSVFVTKDIYLTYGTFDTNFPLSADYDLILRFMHFNVHCILLDST